MKLVLAEKPSVAQSIAKVLGATKREDGYLEGNGYVVSWCVGHLVELSQPEAYDEKYNKWAYADLPIFPDQWKYQVSASTKKQFGILKKLMARKDVESLVCATDAGREGELIFRLVYQQAGCRKPFERLWISSMEDSAIREGFEQLKPSTEYDALYEAALCRERADWLVGINATRLFSTLYGQTLNVGRVMTPTLAMVVMREAAISAFRPEPFYTVELAFQDFTASGERMKQKVLADDVARKCVGSVLNVTKAENKEKSEKPPALYDLTSLQRDANRVLGFTAQQTLDYTQSLYEKKLVTYLAIQTCEDGYDYTLFDKEFHEIDGGQLDNPELSMLEARAEILAGFGLQMRELRVQVYEEVMEKAEAVEAVNASLLDLAKQIDQFSDEYDHYEYADRVDDKKSNIVEIYHDLTNGNAAPYRDFLEQVIEDSDEISVVQAATQLKNELDKAVSRPKESALCEKGFHWYCPFCDEPG